MSAILVTGGSPLGGTVRASGAKNSALKLMAAALLAPGPSVVHNVPDITDVSVMAEVLRHLGAVVERVLDRLGEQPAEVRVALPVLREEDDRRAVDQRDLGAHDEGDAKLLGPNMGADGAGDPIPVREGERADPVLVAGLDQFLRVGCPFQEREVALAPEGNVGI